MPQIDAVTFFPIILWSLIFIVFGYILFNTYGLLILVNMSKIRFQWINYQMARYWCLWNEEEIADRAAWIVTMAPVLKTETTDK